MDQPIHEYGLPSNDSLDHRIAPLRISIFTLTSWIVPSTDNKEERQAHNLAQLDSRLRRSLASASSGAN
jgi:hypothetical protein